MADCGTRVSQALALEPDPVSFARLKHNLTVAGDDIAGRTQALQAAVDEASGRRAFCGLGHQGSGFGETGDMVETVTVDDLVAANIPPQQRLYIKFDVEGAEAGALRGAARTIAQRLPFLAVSAYHRPEDLWALARQIASYHDEYRFKLGSHGADGADLMIYAVPPA